MITGDLDDYERIIIEGRRHRAAGDLEAAVAEFTKAIELEPTRAHALSRSVAFWYLAGSLSNFDDQVGTRGTLQGNRDERRAELSRVLPAGNLLHIDYGGSGALLLAG
ncbi:hypothetical protein ACFJGV_10990 [Cnuibacter sp. UC19_7]|uniref:hypothetical protein n=1 Tax=Cnuibacter sp. UC19_7 TaxID=3350166 RepID=UPI0036701498